MSAPILSVVRVVGMAVMMTGTLAASAARADDCEEKNQEEVKQARAYLKKEKFGAAKERLDKLSETDCGRKDPLVWVALGELAYRQQKLDEAGSSIETGMNLGASNKAQREDWSLRFLNDFYANIGTVEIDGTLGVPVGFEVKIVAILDPARKALAEKLLAAANGKLRRIMGKKFYMPVGTYQFGNAQVDVVPGRPTTVQAADIGSVDGMVAEAEKMGPSEGELPPKIITKTTTVTETKIVEVESESDEYLPWILGGAGAVALIVGSVTLIKFLGRGDQYDLDFSRKSQ